MSLWIRLCSHTIYMYYIHTYIQSRLSRSTSQPYQHTRAQLRHRLSRSLWMCPTTEPHHEHQHDERNSVTHALQLFTAYVK